MTTTQITAATADDGTQGWTVLYLDGTPAQTHGGSPIVYRDRELAVRAAALIEAGTLGDRAHAAAHRTPCQHADYDADGICYGCGKHVARSVGSSL